MLFVGYGTFLYVIISLINSVFVSEEPISD